MTVFLQDSYNYQPEFHKNAIFMKKKQKQTNKIPPGYSNHDSV